LTARFFILLLAGSFLLRTTAFGVPAGLLILLGLGLLCRFFGLNLVLLFSRWSVASFLKCFCRIFTGSNRIKADPLLFGRTVHPRNPFGSENGVFARQHARLANSHNLRTWSTG